jgi:hypothetical protein
MLKSDEPTSLERKNQKPEICEKSQIEQSSEERHERRGTGPPPPTSVRAGGAEELHNIRRTDLHGEGGGKRRRKVARAANTLRTPIGLPTRWKTRLSMRRTAAGPVLLENEEAGRRWRNAGSHGGGRGSTSAGEAAPIPAFPSLLSCWLHGREAQCPRPSAAGSPAIPQTDLPLTHCHPSIHHVPASSLPPPLCSPEKRQMAVCCSEEEGALALELRGWCRLAPPRLARVSWSCSSVAPTERPGPKLEGSCTGL